MPLLDAQQVIDDDRVHLVLFLIFTGFAVYPDTRANLVSIQATRNTPTCIHCF